MGEKPHRVARRITHDHASRTTPHTRNTTQMSAVTATNFAVKASAFTAGRVSLRAKASPVAAKPRGMTIMNYTVTLETPEGTQEIECADDTYVLDAAEVRDPRRLQRRGSRRSAIRRATGPGRVRARAPPPFRWLLGPSSRV